MLVRFAASGVCHSDLHVAQGVHPTELPVVLGHEGAGIVEDVGPGVVGLSAGDHVLLTWLPYCGHCRECVRGAAEHLRAHGLVRRHVGRRDMPLSPRRAAGPPLQHLVVRRVFGRSSADSRQGRSEPAAHRARVDGLRCHDRSRSGAQHGAGPPRRHSRGRRVWGRWPERRAGRTDRRRRSDRRGGPTSSRPSSSWRASWGRRPSSMRARVIPSRPFGSSRGRRPRLRSAGALGHDRDGAGADGSRWPGDSDRDGIAGHSGGA